MWSVQNGRYVDKNPAEQKVWRGFGWEGRPLSDRELVRPSGFEPPTFCSGGKTSICMLLILRYVKQAHERGLRGVERLLCTPLCTSDLVVALVAPPCGPGSIRTSSFDRNPNLTPLPEHAPGRPQPLTIPPWGAGGPQDLPVEPRS